MKTTTSEAYKLFCGDLVKNFDKDWFKVGSKLEFGFQFLEHVPDHAWRPMVKIAIDQWDGWPRNWAKSVKEIYEIWRRDAGVSGIGIKYNRDDDPRFHIDLMRQAFNILSNRDYQSYAYFCDQVSMPRTDRDRVENKHRICGAHEQDKYKIAEIGTRLNRKTNRPELCRCASLETEMPDLTITIPGKPIAKARPRFARRGKFVKTYSCQETEEGLFMLSLMAALREGWQPIHGPVRLEALFMMPIPGTSRKKHLDMALGNIRHVKKPDTDNLLKFIKDCANGILWRDDSQVYSIYATKFYAETPGTTITLRWGE